ncbi:YggT family protein [Kordiimonas pumila]|uniref:YggT family protein n=1 Tax=Kordiimonas pumila TaxID=2161677 RepID=A0ABV7D2Y4_9PROT|nr:YggT family protein [Kordiimonas pumila]
MVAVFWLINTVLDLFKFVLIAYVILSWLVAFNILNTHQQFVRSIMNFLSSLVEPAVRPIRRIIPPINGVDLSVLALFLLIAFVQILINTSIAPLFF